jgi:hypothetical protein
MLAELVSISTFLDIFGGWARCLQNVSHHLIKLLLILYALVSAKKCDPFELRLISGDLRLHNAWYGAAPDGSMRVHTLRRT